MRGRDRLMATLIERQFQDFDLLGIDGSGGADPTPVVGQRRSHESLGGTEVCGLVGSG